MEEKARDHAEAIKKLHKDTEEAQRLGGTSSAASSVCSTTTNTRDPWCAYQRRWSKQEFVLEKIELKDWRSWASVQEMAIEDGQVSKLIGAIKARLKMWQTTSAFGKKYKIDSPPGRKR